MKYKVTCIAAAVGLLLSSCDDILGQLADEIINGGKPTLEVTQKNWPFSQWGDQTVQPGDDFFSYCNGLWYSKAEVGRGTSFESRQTINKYYNTYYFHYNDLPSLKTLLADTAKVDDATVQEQARAYTQGWIDKVKRANSHQQLGNVIGLMLNEGYETVVTPYIYNSNGTIVMALVSRSLFDEVFSDDDSSQRDFRHARRLDTKFTQQLKAQVDVRATDEDYDEEFIATVKAIATAMGMEAGRNCFFFSMDTGLTELFAMPLDALKEQLVYDIRLHDAPYASRSGLEATGHDYMFHVSLLYDQYMNYDVAKYLYDKGFHSKTKQQRLSTICNEMRTTLANRISKLEWMSAATKASAKDKIDKMTFFVGYPNSWYSPALPKLSGRSMVEDVHKLAAADMNLSKHVCGMKVAEAATYMCPQMMNIAADNAFYSPNYNTFFIFPCYMFEPYYREDVLDAWLYAAAGHVIGHEMVHGFDTTGAAYDSEGRYAVSDDKPYGWWTENDAMEYVRRQQLLVASYDKLPFEPWVAPGVYNDGEKCLGENIADCGGLEVALDCYTAHVESAGYEPEDVERLQRLFMQAWAYMWRTKYNKDIIDYLVANDVHSSYYARVIGPTQNCDRWYSLFAVQPSHHHYLPPSERCHIW